MLTAQLMQDVAADRQRDLIAQADRSRLIAAARRARAHAPEAPARKHRRLATALRGLLSPAAA